MDDGAVEALVKKQQKLHLNLGIRDVYKLLFQGVMGVAHILGDKERARKHLENEFVSVDVSDFLGEPLIENISVRNRVIRVNLRPFKRLRLSLNRLFKAMVVSAETMKEDKERFIILWNKFMRLAKAGKLDFDYETLVEFDKAMESRDYPPVHHSKKYMEANKPAYRVVDKKVFVSIFGSLF